MAAIAPRPAAPAAPRRDRRRAAESASRRICAEAFAYSETLVLAVPCASMRALLGATPASGRPPPLRLDRQGHRAGDRQADVGADPRGASGRGRRRAVGSDVRGGRRARRSDGRRRSPAGPERSRCELQYRFSTPQFRFYTSDDLIGVELCGALKNVVAIAAGIVSGLGFGHNTLAALVTRGLAEMDRLVRAQGGTAAHGPRAGGRGRPDADLHRPAVAQPPGRRGDRARAKALRRPGRHAGGGRGSADLSGRAGARRALAGSRRRSPRRSCASSTRKFRPGRRSSG